MDFIFHLIGICPDTHGHFDLLDLIATWDIAMAYISRMSFFIMKTKLLMIEGIKHLSK